MATKKAVWQGFVKSPETGKPVSGAEVRVYVESSGAAATLYGDRDGTPLPGGWPAFSDSSGFVQFYVDPSRIRIEAYDGGLAAQFDDVLVGTVDEGGIVTASLADGTITEPKLATGSVSRRAASSDIVTQVANVTELRALTGLVDGQRILVNKNLWEINTDEGLDLGNGLFARDIGQLPIDDLNDLTDSATGEEFRPALRGRLIEYADAFADMMDRSGTGGAPYITCYGDSNTRYYQGDTATAGPYSRSYGAYIDLFACEVPSLYGATVDIKGFPGQRASWGLSNFSSNVDSSSDFVVIGFGTNDVKLSAPDMNAYMESMLGIFEQCLSIGAMPIVLGIPWYSATYGSDGQLSQDRLKTWNATLYALCTECNVPFIDTYNLTRQFTGVYFNESTTLRHYSPVATKAIAGRIIEVLKNAMKSQGVASGRVIKTFEDMSSFVSVSGAVERQEYKIGGMAFEVLKIPEGGSVSVRGRGRGCVAFYPRATAEVSVDTPVQMSAVTITPAIDAGEYYSVQRQALTFTNFGDDYDLIITADVGDCFVRSIVFEDSSSSVSVLSGSYQEIAGANLPAQGVTGRSYLITDMAKTARYYSGSWRGADGLICVGSTSVRGSVELTAPNGFRFYNTTTAQAEVFDRDAGTWSAL